MNRRCRVCGAVVARNHRHVHEFARWKPRYDDFEGALEGYRTVPKDCPADTPMGSCLPRCGAQECEDIAACEEAGS